VPILTATDPISSTKFDGIQSKSSQRFRIWKLRLTICRSYSEDFLNQYGQYQSQRDIFLASPTTATSTGIVSFRDLIDFVAHVADCFPEDTASFPSDLKTILTLHHASLESELREKIVGSLVLLRRKEIIDSAELLNTLFPILVATPSKTLRALLFQKILSDLRTSNSKSVNHRLNKTIQTALFNLLTSDRASAKGIWAVKITRELWKRQIWTDAKAVEIMKEAALADNEKVIGGGVRFFLGGDKEREELEDESSDEEAGIDIGKLKHQAGINKKSRKTKKSLEEAVKKVKKTEKKKNQPHPLNFSALHLLHDPQGFAETLFSKHLQNSKSKLNLEQKLLVLQLVSRLVGLHKLTVISLYSYFIKYLTPRQPSVTTFLACLAQATHSLVPPDALEPLVQKIANEFVSEASASEVASAGLNAIREICVRQPLAMNDTLLQDLVMYRKSKDKGTVMAAKGLLSLYREVGADLLKKRDRGKTATMGLKSGSIKERRFGEEEVGGIEGLELLEEWKAEERKRKRAEKGLPELGSDESDEDEDGDEEETKGWENWDAESDASSDSGGWINVESDAEIEISDSEDEKPAVKKTKLDPLDTKSKSESETPDSDEEKENADKDKALEQKISKLATTKILTPADLAKLQELRLQASISKTMGKSNSKSQSQRLKELADRHADDPLTAEQIEGLSKLRKSTREEKIALAREGKGERGEHKSTQALRRQKKDAEGKSTTNKEKSRKKNFMMTLGKAKFKQKRSLTQTRRVLKGHIERSKRGGKRGNVGM
jgi:protein SDA1